MKRMVGKRSFTGNFAANSSTFWVLFVLMESDWTLQGLGYACAEFIGLD